MLADQDITDLLFKQTEEGERKRKLGSDEGLTFSFTTLRFTDFVSSAKNCQTH